MHGDRPAHHVCFNALAPPSAWSPTSRGGHPKERLEMNATKMVGIALVVAGALGLAYGSFSYTKETTAVKVGPLELSVKEKETINIPLWAGVGAIVAGGLLLALGGKRG
jgi:spore coat protein U-like protein